MSFIHYLLLGKIGFSYNFTDNFIEDNYNICAYQPAVLKSSKSNYAVVLLESLQSWTDLLLRS